MASLRVLTWHIHGTYLYYLVQCGHQFYIPFKEGRPPGYGGRIGPFPWPDNLHEVPAEQVRNLSFDCVLFQARRNWEADQYEILSAEQRKLPRIYLEHDPPQEHPTNTRHWIDDPDLLLVHCTPFNQLMWDSGRTPALVIDHGVAVPEGVRYTGELDRGITVVNHLKRRGRRLGADVFERVRREIPLDLVGMEAEAMGGLGEVPYPELAAWQSRYRFFFNPIRYTSMGLAVCEAMMIGMPVIGLATTEMAAAIENGVSGYVDTDLGKVIAFMKELLGDAATARRLGEGARRYALERFGIRRFARDWDKAFSLVTDSRLSRVFIRGELSGLGAGDTA